MSHVTHPWQDTPNFFDPFLDQMTSRHIIPRSDESSQMYLTVTTMFNGLQQGHEDVYSKVEADAAYVRMVVDFTSLADPLPRFRLDPTALIETASPRRRGRATVTEPYPRVFTACARNMKPGQILRIKWELDW